MIDSDNIPIGFYSAALKSGLKNNDYDLAIIKSEPSSVVSALYTQNKFQAAPVLFSKKNDKNKRNNTDRLEIVKYCKFCKKRTTHKETK